MSARKSRSGLAKSCQRFCVKYLAPERFGMPDKSCCSTFSANSTVTAACPTKRFFSSAMGASATRRPLLMMMARLQMASTSLRMWVERMTVFSCPNSWMSWRISMIWLVVQYLGFQNWECW